MQNKCPNDDLVVYRKADPSEVIEVGDVLMIDVESALITKAVINDFGDAPLNNRMVVGICVEANNTGFAPITIDGGLSLDVERIVLENDSQTHPEVIIIEGGPSTQNPRELIKLAYRGEIPVNICGYVDLGDKLTISNHPGKAKAIDYTNRDYFKARSIGKVIKYMNNSEQVKVLLDIE